MISKHCPEFRVAGLVHGGEHSKEPLKHATKYYSQCTQLRVHGLRANRATVNRAMLLLWYTANVHSSVFTASGRTGQPRTELCYWNRAEGDTAQGLKRPAPASRRAPSPRRAENYGKQKNNMCNSETSEMLRKGSKMMRNFQIK